MCTVGIAVVMIGMRTGIIGPRVGVSIKAVRRRAHSKAAAGTD